MYVYMIGTSGVPVQGFGYLQGNDGNIRKFTIHGDKNVKGMSMCWWIIMMSIYTFYTHSYIFLFVVNY